MTDTRLNPQPYRGPSGESPADEDLCYILSIPNELLSEILLRVVETETPVWAEHVRTEVLFEQNWPPPSSPVLVLRAVCRQFRETINHFPFWYQDSFNPLDLLPEWPGIRPKYGDNFLNSLVDDQNLTTRLGLKSRWEFHTLQAFLTALDRIPAFRHTVKSIIFKSVCDDPENVLIPHQSNLNIALRHLSFCYSLKSLEIHAGESACHLNLISEFFPTLQELVIYDSDNIRGGLQNLNQLRRLELHTYPLINPSQTLPFFFPVSSANSLTELSIHSSPYAPIFYSPQDISPFVNLTVINFLPLSLSACDFLIDSQLQSLRSFHARVWPTLDIAPSVLLRVFSSASLRSITDLKFRIQTSNQASLLRMRPFIGAIATNLRQLEYMDMDMGLDSDWCWLFSELSNLKVLKWTIRNKDEAFRGPAGFWPDDIFSEVFSGFTEKPSIEVVAEYSEEYWQREEEEYEAYLNGMA